MSWDNADMMRKYIINDSVSNQSFTYWFIDEAVVILW